MTRSNTHTSPMNARGALAAALLAAMVAGCEEKAKAPAAQPPSAPTAPAPKANTASAEFIDTDFGFKATTSAAWRAVPATGIQVPGRILKVWTSDGTNSIVAFVQEAGQPVTAKQLLDSSSAAMKQAGHSVTFEQVVKVSGADAMSLKVTGPGSGAAIGNGTIPTYQHWIAIPKQNRVLVLLLTSPDATKAEPASGFESMVQGITIQ